MEYKVGRLLGNKPKERALSAISDKLIDGDVVLLTSDIIDSVVITSAITLDGQGHTFFVEDEKGAGLILENHIKIQNCHFVIGKKTNGVYARMNNLSLEFENCTFDHNTWDEVFPSVVCKRDGSVAQIICNNVRIDYGVLSTQNLFGTDLILGDPAYRRSVIKCQEGDQVFATKIQLENLTTVKALINGFGQIDSLTVLDVVLDSQTNEVLIGDLMIDMRLDPKNYLTQEVVEGLVLKGNTTINNVVSPELSSKLIKRCEQQGKTIDIRANNEDVVVNINGGEWNIKNKWLDAISQGTLNLIGFKNVNAWYVRTEKARIYAKNTKFNYRLGYTAKPKKTVEPKVEPKVKTAKEKLEAMIGLEEVKKKVQTYISTNVVNKKRRELGMQIAENSLHLVFSGSAGTGKTQIARLLTEILYDNGIVKENKLKEVSAKDMIAEYTGQTSPKTHQLILEALGGVLFIDEAYELIPGGEDDSFKREAITTLVKDMDDYRKDLIVVIAGYTDEMEKFLKVNPGLPSRFVNKIHFPDYNEDELIQIAYLQLKQQNQSLDDAAKEMLEETIRHAKQNGQVDGNGRWVRNLLQFISQARDVRIVADGSLDDPTALNKITLADITEGVTNFL